MGLYYMFLIEMKKILSIIIFISLFSNVRADAGYCYCYEIEIETNHGLKSGFIRLIPIMKSTQIH